MKDITTIADVQQLVHTFYEEVRKDELLGPVFNSRLADQWEEHLEKMVRFWQTILLGEHTYSGYPFHPHATLAIDASHFEKWVTIFQTTVDRLFTGPVADEAKNRGVLMAKIFQHKLDVLDQQKQHA